MPDLNATFLIRRTGAYLKRACLPSGNYLQLVPLHNPLKMTGHSPLAISTSDSRLRDIALTRCKAPLFLPTNTNS